MNKKHLFIVLALVMMMSLCACGAKEYDEAEDSTKTIVTDVDNIVQPIDGDYVLSRNFSEEHQAVDLAAAEGTPILACFDGTVIAAEEDDIKGLYLLIETADGYRAAYCHCGSLSVGEGSKVSAGDVIATVGNTGDSTGAHLHFELEDPDGNMLVPEIGE